MADAFEQELLDVLYEEEARWAEGEAVHDGTLWSRVAFRMASARDKTLPSPIPRKANMDRAFTAKFTKAVKSLVAQDLVRFRMTGGGAQPHGGYHLHQLKGRDIALTEGGRAAVEARREAARPKVVYVESSGSSSYYTITLPKE